MLADDAVIPNLPVTQVPWPTTTGVQQINTPMTGTVKRSYQNSAKDWFTKFGMPRLGLALLNFLRSTSVTGKASTRCSP
jgi:hypothetical protein